jgi:hypothetical protein
MSALAYLLCIFAPLTLNHSKTSYDTFVVDIFLLEFLVFIVQHLNYDPWSVDCCILNQDEYNGTDLFSYLVDCDGTLSNAWIDLPVNTRGFLLRKTFLVDDDDHSSILSVPWRLVGISSLAALSVKNSEAKLASILLASSPLLSHLLPNPLFIGILIAAGWCIWKQRNKRIFEKTNLPP